MKCKSAKGGTYKRTGENTRETDGRHTSSRAAVAAIVQVRNAAAELLVLDAIAKSTL